MAVAIFSY